MLQLERRRDDLLAIMGLDREAHLPESNAERSDDTTRVVPFSPVTKKTVKIKTKTWDIQLVGTNEYLIQERHVKLSQGKVDAVTEPPFVIKVSSLSLFFIYSAPKMDEKCQVWRMYHQVVWIQVDGQ